MMKVKISEVGSGVHPSEVVVAVKTVDGAENLVVSRRSLKAASIEVGYPIRREDDRYLIELPRETSSGSWRVWVHFDQIVDDERARA